jgi:hypothetical protein
MDGRQILVSIPGDYVTFRSSGIAACHHPVKCAIFQELGWLQSKEVICRVTVQSGVSWDVSEERHVPVLTVEEQAKRALPSERKQQATRAAIENPGLGLDLERSSERINSNRDKLVPDDKVLHP